MRHLRRVARAPCAGLLLAAIVAVPAPLSAQAAARRTRDQIQASFDAHKGEFDYLLGDWEFTSVSREFGPGRGYWSAVRLAEGQILDEYRVVGPLHRRRKDVGHGLPANRGSTDRSRPFPPRAGAGAAAGEVTRG